VELSEAAALADVFVFRLMFRIYSLPQALSDYRPAGTPDANRHDKFFQSKRLLGSFAARKSEVKRVEGGRAVDHI
jgi:hypothetical protein